MRVDDAHGMVVGYFQYSTAQPSDNFVFPHQRPALAQSRLSKSPFDRSAEVPYAIENHICRGRVIQFVQGTCDHPNGLPYRMLRRDQVSTADGIPAQHGPGMIQNMENERPGRVSVCLFLVDRHYCRKRYRTKTRHLKLPGTRVQNRSEYPMLGIAGTSVNIKMPQPDSSMKATNGSIPGAEI